MRQAASWLARVQDRMGEGLDITWRSFALEQANSREGPEWKAWEQGPDYESRGLLALRAGEAARRQGAALHHAFTMNLLDARHADRKDIRQRDVVMHVARESGLDMARFERDLDDPDTLAAVAADHECAQQAGVFGTPTFVFEDGTAAFLKMYTPPEEDSMAAFEHFIGMARGRKYFGELKRPQPPWPRGVFDEG